MKCLLILVEIFRYGHLISNTVYDYFHAMFITRHFRHIATPSRPVLNTIKRTLNAIKSITCNSAPKLQTYFYILSNLWGVGSGCQFVTTLIT